MPCHPSGGGPSTEDILEKHFAEQKKFIEEQFMKQEKIYAKYDDTNRTRKCESQPLIKIMIYQDFLINLWDIILSAILEYLVLANVLIAGKSNALHFKTVCV